MHNLFDSLFPLFPFQKIIFLSLEIIFLEKSLEIAETKESKESPICLYMYGTAKLYKAYN
jgi:hypothetical protein